MSVRLPQICPLSLTAAARTRAGEALVAILADFDSG